MEVYLFNQASFLSSPSLQKVSTVRTCILLHLLMSCCSERTLPTVSIESLTTGQLLYCNRDMPPAGGFEAIKYKRNLPLRGPGAYAILGGVTAICAYGFYRVGKGIWKEGERSQLVVERVTRTAPLDGKRGLDPAGSSQTLRELEREKVWSRIYLLPILMAERDREMRRGEGEAGQ
jgi:hypothetical protein